MPWVLVLDPPSGDPTLRVAGLALALRLALDAQSAGASAVIVASGSPAATSLSDRRLRIPVLSNAPSDARRVRVPADYVVFRGLFRRIAEHDSLLEAPPPERDLAKEPFPHQSKYGFDAFAVTDDASRRRAESALFRALRKPEDGWTSRWLNRYISLAVSRRLVKTPLTPNQISLGILAIGLGGACAAASGTEFGLPLGAFLLQTQSVLDGCDGEVSRITHRGSKTGEWLDTIGDDLSNYGFFAGASWGLFKLTGSSWYLAVGAVIVLAGFIASGIEYAYLVKIGSGDLLKYPLSQGGQSGALSYIAPLFKRDTFVLLTLLAALAGVLGPVLCVFALGALGVLASVIATEIRMRRQAGS
ncbi:MAG TPA: CDP-alcohol phosphatidyltransferase family protein [Polyangiaceae bacterium]|nr:CDP-alcohol phosphatidyltransferase family protein [Polyangiaceae bacterium]